MGAYLTFEMLSSTSWTTYSNSEKYEVEEEFGPVSYNSDIEMGIGLEEASLFYYLQECDEDNRCYDMEIDTQYDLLLNLSADDGESIDCKNTEDSEEIMMCDVESTGSTTNLVITGGLGLLGLSIFLGFIGVMGYVPGWIIRILSSLSGIIIFVAPIAWYVMLPDLNSGLEPNEQKWGPSYAFYLTILSGPIVLFGGFFFGKIEAFALAKDEDWDDEDYDDAEDEYSEFSSSTSSQNIPSTMQREHPAHNWQGEWADDGYEWIEHPEGSEIWYWRDQETGQWVRH